MVLEDLFGALTGGQQNNAAQSNSGVDPLASMLGGLLGGQSGSQSGDALSQLLGGVLGGENSQTQSVGQDNQIGSAIGMLEGLMGGASTTGSNANNGAANDPMMLMLTPFVDKLAQKYNIPPQIAVTVVSFAVHQLLSNHPASGRQGVLDIGKLQEQIGSGQGVSHDYLHSTGLVSQLAQQTGLDHDTAGKSLKAVFDMLGQSS